jgi:propionyl-CoA carboxylase alpha chain
VRIDAGVAEGVDVGVFYDSLLAKVIARAPDRARAAALLEDTLRRLRVAGVTTNREFLLDLVRHEDFRAGRLSTHFIDERWPGGWSPPAFDAEMRARMAIAAALFDAERNREALPLLPALRPGWRNNPFRPQRARFTAGGREVLIEYESTAPHAYRARVDGGEWVPVLVGKRTGDWIHTEIDGVRRGFDVRVEGDRRHVRRREHALTFEVVPRFPEHAGVMPGGGCLAPMPGKVVKLLVTEGQAVKAGAPLIIVEAMKMELTLTAPADGKVRAAKYGPGDLFQAGVALVELEASEN